MRFRGRCGKGAGIVGQVRRDEAAQRTRQKDGRKDLVDMHAGDFPSSNTSFLCTGLVQMGYNTRIILISVVL